MNMKVRIKNKWFWLSVIPALLVLIQVVLVPFGYDFEIEPLNSQLIAIVNAAFVLLSILGIAVDLTVEGIGDSDRAMKYEKPAHQHQIQPSDERKGYY